MTKDQKASLRHALLHLESNKISKRTGCDSGGWYCGNQEDFIKRHGKAIKLIRELLEPTCVRVTLSLNKRVFIRNEIRRINHDHA